MNPATLDPVLQTVAVGSTVCAVAALGSFYLWTENRQERYLLFWSIGWGVNALRWSLHVWAQTSPAVAGVGGVLGGAYLVLVLLGAYDIQASKRWGLALVAGWLALVFAVAVVVAIASGRLYEVMYFTAAVSIFVAAAFVWRGYRTSGLTGYCVAALALMADGAFVSGALLLRGNVVADMVVGPLLNIPTAASFVLIAYQRSRLQMRHAEGALRKLFDTAPIPIIMTGAPGGEIQQFNDAALELSGLSPGELRGKTAAQAGIVVEPGKRAEIYEALQRGLPVRQSEITYLFAGKTPRIYALNASRFELDGAHYIFVLSDQTELRQTQRQLEELNAGLEAQVAERTRDLEAFGASVSHDLRAPLRHIGGFLELLEESLGERLDAEGRRLVDTVKESAARMGQMIDDLLRFSRLGSAQLDTSACDLNVVVAEVVAALRPEVAGRDLQWRVGPLPAVHADSALIRQVFWNLLSNAVKYTGPTPHAVIDVEWLAAESTAEEQVFAVRDNGVGFDARYSARLFDVFQRLHKASDFEGSGVGLAIVERIVRKHGGRVWAHSAVGQGASFYFTLAARGEAIPSA